MIQIIDPQNIYVDDRLFTGVDVVLLMYPERFQDVQRALHDYVTHIAEENQGLIKQLASAMTRLPLLEQENANLRNRINQISNQSEDWNGLLADLISPSAEAPKLYEQCYRASAIYLECNAAFTVFITVLTSVRIPEALEDAISRLQGALEVTNNPISDEARAWLNERLAARKMGFQI